MKTTTTTANTTTEQPQPQQQQHQPRRRRTIVIFRSKYQNTYNVRGKGGQRLGLYHATPKISVQTSTVRAMCGSLLYKDVASPFQIVSLDNNNEDIAKGRIYFIDDEQQQQQQQQTRRRTRRGETTRCCRKCLTKIAELLV